MEKRLTTPFTKDKIKDLKAGDSVLITGTIYTARDAAHERMTTNFKNGIPFACVKSPNTLSAVLKRPKSHARPSAKPAEWTRIRQCF